MLLSSLLEKSLREDYNNSNEMESFFMIYDFSYNFY